MLHRSGTLGLRVLSLALILLLSGGSLRYTNLAPGGTAFPRIQGWTLAVNPTVYTRENLWDLIDGAADLFLAYEFTDLTIGDYRNAGGLTIRVELYRHASPQDAFGMYAAERQRDYRFVEIGTQGYGEEGALNFLAGEYYVKMSTPTAGTDGLRALSEVAGHVARHLDRPGRWPDDLRLLPQFGRLPNSEGFVRRDFLGYSFLGSAYTAWYRAEPEIQLFVIRGENTESAKSLVARILQAAGSKTSPSPQGVSIIEDPNNGPLTLLQTGRFLAGIIGTVTPATRDTYLSRLKESLKAAS